MSANTQHADGAAPPGAPATVESSRPAPSEPSRRTGQPAEQALDDWVSVDASHCGVLATTGIVGDQWSLLILRDAMLGVRRFDQYQRHLGVSRTVLADRLGKLVAAGILTREEYQEQGERPRWEYRLTRKGWGLQNVLLALREWGNRYLVSEDERLLELVQASTGEPVELALVRSSDGVRIDPRDLDHRPGPGLRP